MLSEIAYSLPRKVKDRIKRSFPYRVARGLVYLLYFPVAVLLYVCRIRLVQLTNPGRIGHLCIEPDCFVKEGLLGLRPRFLGLLLAPQRVVANKVVIDLWKHCLPVVTSTLACRLLSPLIKYSFVRYSVDHYVVAINDTAAAPRILAGWGDRPPLLKKDWVNFPEGWEALQALGMPPGAWYVCVHSRDGHYSVSDEHLHYYRNSSIENYRLAMQAIVDRGGWCVRVGERTPTAMPPMRGVIDYANSSAKSDWMDVFLCANCRFFLGNSSGLYLLATVFGVHAVLANLIPVSSALPVGSGDLGIPKILRSRKSGQLLTYREILGTPIGNFRYASQYEAECITVEENSPEDIRDLTIEMLDEITTAESRDAKDGRDEQLQQQFKGMIVPGHYSFGANSRIGREFLRKYARLL